MKHIRITTVKQYVTKAERQEDDRLQRQMAPSPFYLILYLIWIAGAAVMGNNILRLSLPLLLTGIAGIWAITGLLWFLYFFHKKIFMVVSLVFGVAAAAAMYPLASASATMGAAAWTNTKEGPVSLLMAVLTAVFLMFLLEFVLRIHAVTFLISAGLITAVPFTDLSFGLWEALALLGCMVGFVVLNMNDRSRQRRFVMKKRGIITSFCVMVTVGLMTIIMLITVGVVDWQQEPLYAQTLRFDDRLHEWLIDNASLLDEDFLSGYLSRGNLHQTGKEKFELSVNAPFYDRLYLREFIGSDYNGQGWDWAELWQEIPLELSDRSPEQHTRYEDSEESEEEDWGWGDEEEEEPYEPTYFVERELFVSPLVYAAQNDYLKEMQDFSDFLKSYRIESLSWLGGSPSMYSSLRGDSFEVKMHSGSIGYDGTGKIAFFLSEDNVVYLLNTTPADTSDYVFEHFSEILDRDPAYVSSVRAIPSKPEVLFNMYSSDYIAEMLYDRTMAMRQAQKEEEQVRSGEALSGAEPDTESPARKLRVKYITDFYGMVIPYYPEFSRSTIAWKMVDDRTAGAEITQASYTVSYLTERDLPGEIDWSGYDAYRNYQQYYQNAIKEQYTNFDPDQTPRLYQLCQDMKLENVNEVTTFILYTLQTHAVYSTSPGNTPIGKDLLEYFLFENGRGYCIHYASTAALMYRMLGVPARFVTGFGVDPAAFGKPTVTQEGDETWYTSTVRDYSAHAWVEIYLEDHGWVPVEVTPTASNTMVAEYPGYDSMEMERIMQKYGWEFRKNAQPQVQPGAGGEGENSSPLITWVSSPYVFIPLCGVLSAAAGIVFLLLRRKRSFRAPVGSSQCRLLFDKLIRMLHDRGHLKEYYGSEVDFILQLSRLSSALSAEETADLVHRLEKITFSTVSETPEDVEAVADYYRRLARSEYDSLPWFRKPMFKYVKAFLPPGA